MKTTTDLVIEQANQEMKEAEEKCNCYQDWDGIWYRCDFHLQQEMEAMDYAVSKIVDF